MTTHQSDTRSVTIDASVHDVFAFLAEPQNLPRWAVGFARSVNRQGDGWVVETAGGSVPLRIESDSTRGTIDFVMTVGPEMVATAFSRVLPNGSGAQYVFTQFQSPEMPDEIFAQQCAALTEELLILPILFRAQAFCPAGQ